MTEDQLTQDGWRGRELGGHMSATGPLWTRRGEQGWQYGLLVAEKNLNPASIVHGGVLATLLDHVLSTVAWEAAGRRPCLTLQLDVHFHASARLGDFLTVESVIVKQTKRLLFIRGQVLLEQEGVAGAQAILRIAGEDR